jgi:hypothetical protein
MRLQYSRKLLCLEMDIRKWSEAHFLRIPVTFEIMVSRWSLMLFSKLYDVSMNYIRSAQLYDYFNIFQKPSVPCRRFTACKRTIHSTSEMLCRPNFLTCFSPVIFSCFAARWLWLLNQADSKKCWQQFSHLLLKYTKSGYGTVLTAACARQGCSATE